jgi:recombinational DNA repair protein RecT
VLSRKQIEARRKRSDARDRGPWVTDFAAMCRKSAIRALLVGGRVPLSSEMEHALTEEDSDGEERMVMADIATPELPGNGAIVDDNDGPPTEDEMRGMTGDSLFGDRDLKPGDPTLTEDPG